MNMNIRIAIAEDDPLTRKQYIERFSFFKHIEIVALAADGHDLLRQINQLEETKRPAIVLMDIEMPLLSGIEAAGQLKEQFPDVEVMMLTVFQDDEKIFQSVRSGASGYLLKDCSTEELVRSVEELADGGVPLAKSIARKVLQFMRDSQSAQETGIAAPHANTFELTAREIEILQQIVQDEKEYAIARNLSISPDTVHTHVKNIYRKLQVHSRGGVVKVAIHHGLVGNNRASENEKKRK